MTIEQLNARYGAPGRIVFREGFAGYPDVVIANKYGSAVIALLGANVLSYRPTGHSEVLFRPAKRDYNRGDGVHCGILVRDRNPVTVRGLDGCTFFNGLAGKPEGPQQGDLKADHEVDHIFDLPAAPKHEFVLVDPGLGRAIAIVSSGNTKTAVWNPDTSYVIEDHTADDWKKFLCVEPVSDWPGGGTLAPGTSHELLAAIQAVMRG